MKGGGGGLRAKTTSSFIDLSYLSIVIKLTKKGWGFTILVIDMVFVMNVNELKKRIQFIYNVRNVQYCTVLKILDQEIGTYSNSKKKKRKTG